MESAGKPMKIYAIVRTRDEHRNIERFCKSYGWVDKILVADGGSVDDTVSLARQFPKVEVRSFDQRVSKPGKSIWRNPEGAHYNFLIDWAESEGAEWILHDDCDCAPTLDMQTKAREILESLERHIQVVLVYRIYAYMKDCYFPQLNNAGHSLWGWRAGQIRFDETDPWNVNLKDFRVMESYKTYSFERPYSLMHYFCPDQETLARKANFYRESGQIPGYADPMMVCGPLAQLEPWMVVE